MHRLKLLMTTVLAHNRASTRPKPIQFHGDTYGLRAVYEGLHITINSHASDPCISVRMDWHGGHHALSLLIFDTSTDPLTEKVLNTVSAIARDMVRRKQKEKR